MKFAAMTLLLVLCGCGSKPPPKDPASIPSAPSATPVSVSTVSRATLPILVRGPGRTATLSPQKVRAPFDGQLINLSVSVGDRVQRGQELARLVAQNSFGELEGAQALLRAARTEQDKADAERAVANARAHLVARVLRAPSSGVVVARASSQDDLVSRGDELLTLAPAHSIVFLADVVQTALPSIHAGQTAEVALAAAAKPFQGRVHGILPAAPSTGLQAQVRVDLPTGTPAETGLFGTADITVGAHRDALVVPTAAVLRDDVSGTSQVALVTSQNTAHWVTVQPGLSENGLVELLSPNLAVGQQVIVSGQVGLPDGTPVEIQR